jgi:hypothetical protein
VGGAEESGTAARNLPLRLPTTGDSDVGMTAAG